MAIDQPLSSTHVRVMAPVGAPSEVASTTLAILTVAMGYYAAAKLGMSLRFPHSTPSVLWPPNALLTAVLLLTAPRRWWIYLLAAFPAHLIVELHGGWPPALVVALFLTNCIEALLAAGGVLWLTGAAGRFDTVSRTVVFLLTAVVGATFLSTFLDATVVWQMLGEPYWTVWRTRFFSNALATLTIVPAVVLTVREAPAWLRHGPWQRKAEAALLTVCVVVGGVLAFASPTSAVRGGIGPVHDPLILTIPILLWAAVRFGPGGSSLALLFTTVIAIGGGMNGRGPFAALAPETGVLALQLFLGAAGIPLLLLGSASRERRAANVALQDRLRFEGLHSGVTAALAHVPFERVNEAIHHWLGVVCEFFEADRGVLLLREPDAAEITVAHQWQLPELAPLPERLAAAELPELARRLAEGELVVVRSIVDSPSTAGASGAWLRRLGVQSAIFAPLGGAGRLVGGFALLRRRTSAWVEGEQRTSLIAELFAGAIVRQESERARRAAEELEAGLLSSLPNQVAILDRAGRITAVNESWSRLTAVGGSPALIVGGAGADYLAACNGAAESGGLESTDAEAGVRSVLTGAAAEFGCEYLSRAPTGDRWFAMSVAPLERAAGGAIVSHTDITRLKESAAELQASRQELAHFNRLATMGELTASLAHELSQPLTAILLKAETARRFVAHESDPEGELLPTLEDLVADARRASLVVRRSRELLSKQAAVGPLDLHLEIRGVAKLLASDARRRGVELALKLVGGRAPVRGDRVQLQQVLLNLLLNAFDASAGQPGAAVTVRSVRLPLEVEVEVSDTGAGVSPEVQAKLFEPFFTTKPQGMGMGLSICRTILKAHGGEIQFVRGAGGGATFRVRLPLAGGQPEGQALPD